MKTKRSVYNLIFSIFSQIVTFSFGIILPRLFLTNLGSEANGLVTSVGQIFSYVAFLEMGISATTIQALYKPIAQQDRDSVNRVLAASFLDYRRIGIVYSVCVFVVAFCYPFIVHTSIPKWQIIGVIFFTGMGGAINFLLQQNYIVLLSAEGKNYVTTNLNLLVNVLVSFTKAILLMKGYNIVIISASQFIITLLRILLLRLYLRKEYTWLDFSVKPDFQALSKRKYVLAQEISYFVYRNTDVVILTFFCDLKVVSVYTIYNLIIGVVEGIVGAFSTSVVSALGLLYNEDKKRFKKIYEIYDAMYMSIVFIAFTVVYICIIPFIELYTQGVTDINYSDEKIAILFVVLKMVSTLRSQSQNTISFAGKFKETQKSAILESVINLVVSIVGVMTIGIYGVLLGSILGTLYRGISVTNYSNKFIFGYTKKECMRKYLRWGTNIVVFVLIGMLVRSRVPVMQNYMELFLFAVFCGICVCLAYLFTFCVREWNLFKETLELVKEKVRK